jgi:hypothetical protein
VTGPGPGRIRIEPVTREQADALSNSDAESTRRFGGPVEAGWAGFPEELPIIIAAAHDRGPGPWGPHLFFGQDGVSCIILDPPSGEARKFGAAVGGGCPGSRRS